jgi:hypothetical protein
MTDLSSKSDFVRKVKIGDMVKAEFWDCGLILSGHVFTSILVIGLDRGQAHPILLINKDIFGRGVGFEVKNSTRHTKDWGIDPKFVGSYGYIFTTTDGKITKIYAYDTGGSNSAAALQYPNGMSCSGCRDHNKYALPNISGNRYACRTCRQTRWWVLGIPKEE